MSKKGESLLEDKLDSKTKLLYGISNLFYMIKKNKEKKINYLAAFLALLLASFSRKALLKIFPTPLFGRLLTNCTSRGYL